MKKNLAKQKIAFKKWIEGHTFQIFVFNLLMILLFLLRSVGYFQPYFSLTVNAVVIILLISAIFLLGARSSAFYVVALFFWLLAAFLRVVRIEEWAERSALYSFQALLIGTLILFYEIFRKTQDRA